MPQTSENFHQCEGDLEGLMGFLKKLHEDVDPFDPELGELHTNDTFGSAENTPSPQDSPITQVLTSFSQDDFIVEAQNHAFIQTQYNFLEPSFNIENNIFFQQPVYAQNRPYEQFPSPQNGPFIQEEVHQHHILTQQLAAYLPQNNLRYPRRRQQNRCKNHQGTFIVKLKCLCQRIGEDSLLFSRVTFFMTLGEKEEFRQWLCSYEKGDKTWIKILNWMKENKRFGEILLNMIDLFLSEEFEGEYIASIDEGNQMSLENRMLLKRSSSKRFYSFKFGVVRQALRGQIGIEDFKKIMRTETLESFKNENEEFEKFYNK